MEPRCLICAGDLAGGESHETHARCARWLFGTARVPKIELDPENLYLFGQEMAGRVTLSGVQSKVSLGWSQRTLRVRAEHAAFLLKPQTGTYPELPENEHACLRIAQAAGIEVARAGLVRLSNGSLALVVRRFDRGDDGRRIPMEDFCQLAELQPRQKYDGSAELCARVVRRYSAEPGIDALRLCRQVVVSWWVGNGDLHLKNLSLFTAEARRPRLSPAYDLLSTALVIRGDVLALPVGGRKDGLGREDWMRFGAYCRIPPRQVESALDEIASRLDEAKTIAGRSFLRAEFRERLCALLDEHRP